MQVRHSLQAYSLPAICLKAKHTVLPNQKTCLQLITWCATELKSKPGGAKKTSNDGAAKSPGQQMQLPFSAIQNLARLIEEQRSQSELSMQSIRASPFQGRPVSPPKAEPKSSSELAMRHCFSEGSAKGLGALSKQVSKPPPSLHPGRVAYPCKNAYF